jgi:hypothetical protein
MEAQKAAASRACEFYVDRPIYIVLVKARAKHAAEGYRGEASEPVTFATTLLGSSRRRRGTLSRQMVGPKKGSQSGAPPNILFHVM